MPKALCLAKVGMALSVLSLLAFIVLILAVDGLLLHGKKWLVSFFTGEDDE